MTETSDAPTRLADIPGWFTLVDQRIFRALLRNAPTRGDLVEMGVYLGKSAAWMGKFLREGERFTVIDLFNEAPTDTSNSTEMQTSYRNLTREAFEHNYRSLRGTLPEIVTGPSSQILYHVAPGSARFVHVDASHLYEHVVIDVASSEKLLQPDGVVAFDDYRSVHTPGVAAAVWPPVVEGRLKIVCLSANKMYATFGDPTAASDTVLQMARRAGDMHIGHQTVAGQPVLLIREKKKPAATARA